METLPQVQVAPKFVAKNEGFSFLATASIFLEPTKFFVENRKANNLFRSDKSATAKNLHKKSYLSH